MFTKQDEMPDFFIEKSKILCIFTLFEFWGVPLENALLTQRLASVPEPTFACSADASHVHLGGLDETLLAFFGYPKYRCFFGSRFLSAFCDFGVHRASQIDVFYDTFQYFFVVRRISENDALA